VDGKSVEEKASKERLCFNRTTRIILINERAWKLWLCHRKEAHAY
jgi:hypothetical protein